MQQHYDLAIIGGGLAGLCLAIQSADAGYKTVLFEKEQYPFHKVCGEYISLESKNFLERLGVPLEAWQLPIINTLHVTDVKGSLYAFNLPLGGFGVSRYKLDDCLYHTALQKGVTMFTETKVNDVVYSNESFTITSNKQVVTAKVAAGTYGKRSNIDVKLSREFVQQKPNKLNNYIGIKYHVSYPQPIDTITLHNFKDGYCGISNIEDGKCCLCYLTTAANLQQSNNQVKVMEENILSKNPHLKRIFSEATFLYKAPLAISQVSFVKKLQVEDHLLMIGDAAGMITPLCGNGMSMAMHGSKLAFNNINNFLSGTISRKTLEENYTMQWQKQFAKRLWIGRNVQRVFGGTTTTGLFFKTMHSMPFIAKQVIKSTHGEVF